MQSLSCTLALRLTQLYLGTIKLRFFQKKLSRTNRTLSKLRYYIPTETLTSIYYSPFQSFSLYGSTIWCHISQKNMKISIFQKRWMRLTTFSEFEEHTTPIFKSFKILTLQDIIKFTTLKVIYLYYKVQWQLKIKDTFTTNESANPYNTREGKLLFIPVNTTHYGINSLRYNGSVIWNDFFWNTDIITTSLMQVSKFKHYLKYLLISQYNID